MPSLVAGTPEGEEMSEWIGIGGVGSNNQLIQAGVSETPDSRTPNAFFVFPWWEVYPTDSISMVINSVVVSAGDEVTVGISQISGSEWVITLSDDTNGQSRHHRSNFYRQPVNGRMDRGSAWELLRKRSDRPTCAIQS